MPIIVDLDTLVDVTDVVVDTATKTIVSILTEPFEHVKVLVFTPVIKTLNLITKKLLSFK